MKSILKKIDEKKILIEEYIEGTDFTVALMNGKILGLLEIIPKESFYSFSAKYKNSQTVYRYPKKLNPKKLKKYLNLRGLQIRKFFLQE